MDAVVGAVRTLFAWIDWAIYSLIDNVYNFLIDISMASIFNTDILSAFNDRVYAFLGLFMLFKLSFSLIKYIIHPDEFYDKAKGGKKMLLNIIVVLILIVTTPMIFEKAMDLQRIILKDNVIPNFIIGVKGDDISLKNVGKEMSRTVLSAFYYPTCPNGIDIGSALIYDNDGKVKELSAECKVFGEKSGDTISADEKAYIDAYNDADINKLFFGGSTDDFVRLKNGKEWTMNYTTVVSTIAGAFVGWILFMFCFDVAIRLVKLGFLQLIAPIPIVSYISPESSKSGLFRKWLKMTISTYLDLFIRLIALFFAIFVISLLTEQGSITNMETGDPITSIWVKLFIILGALMFANQLPKLIEDLTGHKMGGFTLNPMNKIGQSTYASAVVGGAMGAIGGAAANTWALKNSVKKDGWDKTFRGEGADGEAQTGFKALKYGARQIFSGTGGGISAGLRGVSGGLQSGGKGNPMKIGTSAITQSSAARNLRGEGFGFKDTIKDRASDMAGVKFDTGTTSTKKNAIKRYEQELANHRRRENAAAENFGRLVADSGYAKSLNAVFNNEAIIDETGKITGYKQKTYDDYIDVKAREYAESQGQVWNDITDENKATLRDYITDSGVEIDKNQFDNISSIYDEIHKADMDGRKAEKSISDIQEDLARRKPDKK